MPIGAIPLTIALVFNETDPKLFPFRILHTSSISIQAIGKTRVERDPISLAKSFPETSNCASSTKSCSGHTTSMIYLRLFFPFPTLENCQWRHVYGPPWCQLLWRPNLQNVTIVLWSVRKRNKRKKTDLGKNGTKSFKVLFNG